MNKTTKMGGSHFEKVKKCRFFAIYYSLVYTVFVFCVNVVCMYVCLYNIYNTWCTVLINSHNM